jgi:hypothetical protein
MLPGLRFLSVAVVLAVSMLIFGLGAAALLRATHGEFASLPLRQMPEVTFASRPEPEQTLAVLQVDTPDSGAAPPNHDQDAAQNQPIAEAPNSADAPTTANANQEANGSAAPSASADPSDPGPPKVAEVADSANATRMDTSEQPPTTQASAEAADVKADTKTDPVKSDAATSEVAETMISPFGKHFRPPLPVSRSAQAAAHAAHSTPAKRSSAKPHAATRHRPRRVRRSHLARPAPVYSPRPVQTSAPFLFQ